MKKHELTLVRATPRNIPLIKRWLARPAVLRGWGGAVGTVQELRGDLAIGQREIHPFLICLKNRGPAAFCRCYDSLPYVDEYMREITPGGFNIDIFIAVRGLRGRGIGSRAIREARRLANTAASLEQAPPAFYAWILQGNKASQRAFEKCGYRLYDGSDAVELLPVTIYWLDGVARKPNP